MPIYEYRCEKGHTFEVMQRIGDDPVAVCQVCGAQVQRVFHPIAVHFKGSGFYSTDYGSRKRSRELKEAAEANGKSSKDGDSTKSKSDGKSSKDGDGAKKSDSTASSTAKND